MKTSRIKSHTRPRRGETRTADERRFTQIAEEESNSRKRLKKHKKEKRRTDIRRRPQVSQRRRFLTEDNEGEFTMRPFSADCAPYQSRSASLPLLPTLAKGGDAGDLSAIVWANGTEEEVCFASDLFLFCTLRAFLRLLDFSLSYLRKSAFICG